MIKRRLYSYEIFFYAATSSFFFFKHNRSNFYFQNMLTFKLIIWINTKPYSSKGPEGQKSRDLACLVRSPAFYLGAFDLQFKTNRQILMLNDIKIIMNYFRQIIVICLINLVCNIKPFKSDPYYRINIQ